MTIDRKRAAFHNPGKNQPKSQPKPQPKIQPEPLPSQMNMDWDYLIVLDACRYDVFSWLWQTYIGKGELIKYNTNVSCTEQWIKTYLKDDTKYRNIVMVTANPRLSNAHLHKALGFSPFKNIIEVWKLEEEGKHKYIACPPDKMVEKCVLTLGEYPGRRKIFWFMQPHIPYMGDIQITDFQLIKRNKKAMMKGFAAYVANVRLVLIEITKLIATLNGRIIITSDHGEAFGYLDNLPIYNETLKNEHPCNVKHPVLNQVPLLIIDKRDK